MSTAPTRRPRARRRPGAAATASSQPDLPLQWQMWSSRRLAYGLLPALRVYRERGVDVDALLERCGIDAFGLLDTGYTVSIDDENRVHARATAAIGDPTIGLALGKAYHLRSFSVLGLTMQASANLLAMLSAIQRYPQLAWGCFDGRIRSDGDALLIEFLPQPRLGALEPLLLERDMACAKTLIDEVRGEPLPLRTLRFAHAAPTATARTVYSEVFATEVRFAAQANQMVISRADALRPLPQADAAIATFYAHQCARLCRALEQPFRYADAVTERLRACTPIPDLPAMAAALTLTPRTLQRRLAREQAHFGDLLRQVREERAQQLLREPGQLLERVAAALGYADAVAFSHAFKSWTGQAPQTWRQTQGLV